MNKNLFLKFFNEGKMNKLGASYGHYLRSYPVHLANSSLMGFSKRDLTKLALLQDNQYGGDLAELNDAGTYFDMGLRQTTQDGRYYYMCSRNNNFSNRDQKGMIVVQMNEFVEDKIDSNGGVISTE